MAVILVAFFATQVLRDFSAPAPEAALSGLRADAALLSSSAVEGRTAFHQDGAVLEVKRRMVASAARRSLLVDHRKFGRTAVHLLTHLDVLDAVVRTDGLDGKRAAALRRDGVRLHFAGKD